MNTAARGAQRQALRRRAPGAGQPAARFAGVALRGSGQVIFMNSPWTGLLNLLALCWGAAAGGTSWAVVLGAVVGGLVATAAGQALPVSRDALAQGLYGFNGLLVGAALPTFLAPTARMWALLVLAAAASTVVAWALQRLLRRAALPGLTFPFVVTTWAVLGMVAAWPALRVSALPALDWAAPAAAFGVLDFARAVLVSVAQVFFVDDAMAGAIFVLALAVHSRPAALLACAGAAVAVALAWAAGADRAAIAHGMWGYSAALTAVAVGGVFLRSGPTTWALALGAAAATVGVQAGVFALAGRAGLPSLTIAFVVATWAVLWGWRRACAKASDG